MVPTVTCNSILTNCCEGISKKVSYDFALNVFQTSFLGTSNLLKTKRRLLHLKTQSVRRNKHFSSPL
jgi:hypothetical protein